MSQGERIKFLRKELGLTLEKFGDRVGVTKQTISRIENGINNLTDQMAKSICREFNVSYAWLVDGEGEMFNDVPNTVLELAKQKYDLDDLDILIIEKYLQIPADKKQVVKDYIKSIVDAEIEKKKNKE